MTVVHARPVSAISDHGALDASSLLDDDHLQYLLLANRVGGQVIGSQGVARILSIEDSGTVERVRIGEDTDQLIQLTSTTQTFGLMAMTEAQRDLIGAPSTGALVFNTTTSQVNQYNGSAWTVPGAGLTTLQGAYDNDPSGAQIMLNATPDPITIQATVAGTVFAAQDVGASTILEVTADPDRVIAEAGVEVNDAFTNSGAAASIIMNDTFTTGGAYVGGGIQSLGTVTYNNATFIWALLQESKVYEAAVAPGFAAFTLFNALAQIRNSGNFNLVQSLTLNVGVRHSRVTSGTSTVISNNGVNFAARIDATVSGAVCTRTNCNFATVAPTFSTVAGSTVNLGTIRGIQFVQPAIALFGSGAGTENMTAYYGIDFPDMTFGGASAVYSVIRSQLNTGTNKRFLDHTGNASSRLRGHLIFDVDAFGVILGASSDVLMRWLAGGQLSFFGFGTASDLQISTAAANRFLINTAGGSTTGEFNMNALKMSFGAQTGAVGNQKFSFVSGAETITVAGEYSGMLWTYAANDTINAALSLYATATWNAGNPTIGTGSLTTNCVLNVGGNPTAATVNRVGVRIISNPSGGSGINAALWVTAGLSRFDGRVDINNGIALGGGAAATLGTIGGSGPTAAAQATWVEIDINGVAHWIPAWT